MEIQEAAVRIQSLLRGYYVRKNLLSKTEREKANELTSNHLDSLPRASHGTVAVYLPSEISLVIKVLGYPRSKRRFFANWNARQFCRKERFNDLIVPRCIQNNEFVIEEKLPVDTVTLWSQTQFYMDNLPKFSQVVKQFTSFLIKTHFPDILTISHPYQDVSKKSCLSLGRSDNIPFFLSQEKVQIGLIDLGGHYIRNEPADAVQIKQSVETAIAIFPYHLEEICEVAKVSCSDFEELSHRLQALFRIICLGEKIIRKKVDHEKMTSELALQFQQKKILYYNFYQNRENQLMVIIHQ